MEHMDLSFLRNLAIAFIYFVLMGTAAFGKLKEKRAPEWFVKPFEGTLIAKMPGGAVAGYWIIAVFEAALAISFLLSPFVPHLLPVALIGSLYLFGILCLGLRLTGEFQGSANMFIYFASTLISLTLV